MGRTIRVSLEPDRRTSMASTYGHNGNARFIDELSSACAILELEQEPETEDPGVSLGFPAAAAVSQPFLRHDASGTARPTDRRAPEQDRVADLAQSLARALSESVEKQEERLDASIDCLTVVKETNERLTETVASLQEADSRQQSAADDLRRETRELAASIAGSLDALSGRLDVHQQELSAVKSAVSDVLQKVTAVSERLDRQAEVMRSLCESPTVAEVALDQLVEIWVRLRSTHAHPEIR